MDERWPLTIRRGRGQEQSGCEDPLYEAQDGAIVTVDTSAVNDPIALAAETLHYCGEPGAGARLRDEHACDRLGRCRGCPHEGTVAPRFPCLLRLIGEAAADLDHRSTMTQGDPK